MTKTLADMAAEERADCVGMWADTPGEDLAIIASASEPDVSWVFFPQNRGDSATLLNLFIAPRFDLPRAWTPNGQPELAQALAAERCEYCVQMWMGIKWLSLGQGYGMFSIESRGIWWETRDKAQDFMDKCETEHSLRIVRRRVSPVEVINE